LSQANLKSAYQYIDKRFFVFGPTLFVLGALLRGKWSFGRPTGGEAAAGLAARNSAV